MLERYSILPDVFLDIPSVFVFEKKHRNILSSFNEIYVTYSQMFFLFILLNIESWANGLSIYANANANGLSIYPSAS